MFAELNPELSVCWKSLEDIWVHGMNCLLQDLLWQQEGGDLGALKSVGAQHTPSFPVDHSPEDPCITGGANSCSQERRRLRRIPADLKRGGRDGAQITVELEKKDAQ
ncbi:hypothetical protein NDU88_007853 [Pleurodeles waltl]|uniref:Uncharacterized protein n=1 Tax=Pleurodeles waltl TaxID=8319 RepID=A0AAV7PV25_PLEWA|nr:hypothetical protein NDU88_007853 [Pleurodeles waltl]